MLLVAEVLLDPNNKTMLLFFSRTMDDLPILVLSLSTTNRTVDGPEKCDRVTDEPEEDALRD
jgi:hypothetical protein